MPSRGEELFRRVASEQPGPLWLGGLRTVARGVSWLYGLGSSLHHLGYDLGCKEVRRLPVPVIGVGNLAVGGTGKTPLTMAVAESLTRLGLPCGVISRGYGRASRQAVTWVSRGEGPLVDARQAGDEPVMMAQRLKAPITVGAERYEAGREMLRQMGARVLVGDDMFQHRRLHRDLDILALDAASPLEGGRLLPRGRLRESWLSCRRAQALVLTRADDMGRAQAAMEQLRRIWGEGPILQCRHRLAGLRAHGGGELQPNLYNGSKVLAFCGLASPRRFAGSLAQLGLKVAGLEPFGDHYFFSEKDLASLWEQAQKLGAEALVCSEKDAVRLPNAPEPLKIWVTRLDLEFRGGPQSLDALLAWGLKSWTK